MSKLYSSEEMKSLYARCILRPILISRGVITDEVLAYCLGDFATHESADGETHWVITHLSSGLNFDCLGVFRNADQAVPVLFEMMEVNGGRGFNDPHVVLQFRKEWKGIFTAAGAMKCSDLGETPKVFLVNLNRRDNA